MTTPTTLELVERLVQAMVMITEAPPTRIRAHRAELLALIEQAEQLARTVAR